MGRWSQYDEDDYRLPEGMQRVGYDADTQTYTYKDRDGSYWEGSSGARYGNLIQVSSNTHRTSTDDQESDLLSNAEGREEGPSDADIIRDMEKRDWRLFAPFVVLLCVVLILLFRFLTGTQSPGSHLEETPSCGEHESVYTIRSKDTCWAIAQKYGMSVAELMGMNEMMNCDVLRIDEKICVSSE